MYKYKEPVDHTASITKSMETIFILIDVVNEVETIVTDRWYRHCFYIYVIINT